MSLFLQNPIFAAASASTHHQGGDDIDFNEIFSEIFTDEFETNPINAYSGTMGNNSYYSGSVVPTQQALAGPPGALMYSSAVTGTESLPTSGKRPAFHPAAVVAPVNQGVNFHQLPTKKAKVEPHAPGIVFPQPGGLTGRLGVPMPFLQGQYGSQGVAAQLGANPGLPDNVASERRQRNREHAKRSRVRKKFMLESLQEQVSSLQAENQRLRTLIQDNITEHAQRIISECCSKNTLFGDRATAEAQKKKATALVRSDFQLIESLTSGQQNFVLSDPSLPDNPIVFATDGFYKLTGYTPDKVLGRNCRFLQGPGTDRKTVDILRKAIAKGSDCTVCILNYKADGTPFWNQFFVGALRDSDNSIVNYVGVQTEIEPDAGANALEDRVNMVVPLQNKDEEE